MPEGAASVSRRMTFAFMSASGAGGRRLMGHRREQHDTGRGSFKECRTALRIHTNYKRVSPRRVYRNAEGQGELRSRAYAIRVTRGLRRASC